MSSGTSASLPAGSVQAEIKKTEDSIQRCYDRIEDIQKRLRVKALTASNREMLEKELLEMRDMLDAHEKALQDLRKENMKLGVMAVILFFLCFLVYSVYAIFTNP